MNRPLADTELLQLQRWNTPTIYNGWEQITKHDSARDAFNLQEVRDFLPAAPLICGWAVTVVIQPGDRSHILAARSCHGLTPEQTLAKLDAAAAVFGKAAREHFDRDGEWQ